MAMTKKLGKVVAYNEELSIQKSHMVFQSRGLVRSGYKLNTFYSTFTGQMAIKHGKAATYCDGIPFIMNMDNK